MRQKMMPRKVLCDSWMNQSVDSWKLVVRLVLCSAIVTGCSRLVGCDGSSGSAAVGESPVSRPLSGLDSNRNYDLTVLLAEAKPIEGQVLFTQCSACHSLEPGVRSTHGPNLYGLFGRQAGKDAFQYSDAFRGAKFVWDAEKLDQWLRDPRGFIQGSRMVFVPIDRPSDRANLIVYLMQQTDAPTPIKAGR